MSDLNGNFPALKTGLSWPAVFGVVASVLFFGGAIAWSWVTEISGAVIAQGQIEVEGKAKSVQHLDGGVIEEINVSDGQLVEKNEVLVRLDDTLLKANLLIYKTRLSEAMATRDRLIAEQLDADEIAFQLDDPLLADIASDLHKKGQQEVFKARRDLEAGRKEQLAEKTLQYGNQIDGVNGLIAAKTEQGRLLDRELAALTTLADKGLTRASQLLTLQRQQADLLGQVAEHRSELARIQNSIRDTELEVLQGERQLIEEVVMQQRELVTQIQELRQQIFSTQKQLDRVKVRAPSAGRVHELQVTTIGGVVPPGATILQIIPSDQKLSFRTRINPVSVDQVYIGQPVRMRFSAFSQRTTPELNGEVALLIKTAFDNKTED